MRQRSCKRWGVVCALAAVALAACAAPALAGPGVMRTHAVAQSSPDVPVVDPWTNVDVVTVLTSVLSDDGLFDQVRFAVDDGAYGAWQTLAPETQIQLPPLDGTHEIHIQLASSLMDPGEYGSVDDPVEVDVPTILDTQGPVTIAPDVLQTLLGRPATLSFSVTDNLSSKADVRLAVSGAKGRTLKSVRLGWCRTGVHLTRRVALGLPRGRYHYSLLATDLAGNAQRRAGGNVLVIR